MNRISNEYGRSERDLDPIESGMRINDEIVESRDINILINKFKSNRMLVMNELREI